jgi:hypothetical protein
MSTDLQDIAKLAGEDCESLWPPIALKLTDSQAYEAQITAWNIAMSRAMSVRKGAALRAKNEVTMAAHVQAKKEAASAGGIAAIIVVALIVVLILVFGNSRNAETWHSSNGEACSQAHTANWCAQAEGKPLAEGTVQHAEEVKAAEGTIHHLEELKASR